MGVADSKVRERPPIFQEGKHAGGISRGVNKREVER